MLSNRDFLNIGSVPCDEDCAQVGSPDYSERSRKECNAFMRQLHRTFPNGEFSVKSFPHDFGSYREVVAWFYCDPRTEQEQLVTDAAFEAESNTPQTWDEEARAELGL